MDRPRPPLTPPGPAGCGTSTRRPTTASVCPSADSAHCCVPAHVRSSPCPQRSVDCWCRSTVPETTPRVSPFRPRHAGSGISAPTGYAVRWRAACDVGPRPRRHRLPARPRRPLAPGRPRGGAGAGEAARRGRRRRRRRGHRGGRRVQLRSAGRPRPASDASYDYGPAPARLIARANRIADRCEAHGVTLPQAAVAFVLRHHTVVSVVVGARDASQMDAALARAASTVPAALWNDLESAGLLRR